MQFLNRTLLNKNKRKRSHSIRLLGAYQLVGGACFNVVVLMQARSLKSILQCLKRPNKGSKTPKLGLFRE